MLNKQDIINYYKNLSIDEQWSFNEYKIKDTKKLTHCYHSYPARFIPQIPEKLMDEYLKIENRKYIPIINDPFMGCGTTIVSALCKGFKACGTDINKIAYLITKVKATPIRPDILNKQINKLLWSLSFLQNNNQYNIFVTNLKSYIPQKHIDRIKYWFVEQNIEDLGIILNLIYKQENEDIRDFFLVAFSSILKNCSMWSKNSIKASRDLNKKIVKPFPLFKRHLLKMQERNEQYYNILPWHIEGHIDKYLNIMVGDARNQPVDNETVDLIITSSPYALSYEYAELYELSNIWLDLADDLLQYKKQFIGTKYKVYNDRIIDSAIAQEIINQIKEIDSKQANKLNTFYIDIQQVIQQCYRILKNQCRCCFVIGNSKFRNIDILNAQIYTELLIKNGFNIERVIKREYVNKYLPQNRDKISGKFISDKNDGHQVYPCEYIIISKKQ